MSEGGVANAEWAVFAHGVGSYGEGAADFCHHARCWIFRPVAINANVKSV